MGPHADAIREALERIADANDGRITAEQVVSAAEDPTSPLHEHFEWDDATAAKQRRLDQARTLIRSVRVVINTHKRVVSTVFYVRDPSAEANEQGYVSIAKLRTDADLARAALVDEFSRAASLLQRARDLAEGLGLAEQLDEVVQDIGALKERVFQHPEARA